MTSVRIAFISPCGHGNLGDVAIQDSFIRGARERLGDAIEIVGITQNPPDTEERHHVSAIPMDTQSFTLSTPPSAADQADPPVGSRSPGPRRGVFSAAKALVKEVVHWGKAAREMHHADHLVVSGGGQLDDHWGGPWRVPYALWKWSLLARLFGNDVVFLSVGAGSTESRLTRWFLRRALGRARYASFRDERTARTVASLDLSASSRVVPDLAFGHNGRHGVRQSVRNAANPVVALSPIAFLDPETWPAKDADRYRSSQSRTLALIVGLLDSGYDIVLCTSDAPDVKSAFELCTAACDPNPVRGQRVQLLDTRTPADLLNAFGRAGVAIASRLHGLILANLAATPTIALSYDWKVDAHMSTMGLERFSFPIGTFEPDDVVRAVDDVMADRDALAFAIAEHCDRLATAVASQFDDVFAAWGGRQLSGPSL